MTNREDRPVVNSLHMFIGLARRKYNGNSNCIRTVIKPDVPEEHSLYSLESKLIAVGGSWRIHKTVNARDVQKARIWLIHKLIDNPSMASYIDTAWRTALLQSGHVYGEKKWMLDVDTKNQSELAVLNLMIDDLNLEYFEKHESPNGWHYIISPCDTREICKLDYVSLQRDGYYYIKSVEYPE